MDGKKVGIIQDTVLGQGYFDIAKDVDLLISENSYEKSCFRGIMYRRPCVPEGQILFCPSHIDLETFGRAMCSRREDESIVA